MSPPNNLTNSVVGSTTKYPSTLVTSLLCGYELVVYPLALIWQCTCALLLFSEACAFKTDSSTTASPPKKKPSDFLLRTFVSWLPDTRKDGMKIASSLYIFLFAKGYRTTTSRWQGAPLTQTIPVRPGAGFKTGDFVQKIVGGGLYLRTTAFSKLIWGKEKKSGTPLPDEKILHLMAYCCKYATRRVQGRVLRF